MNEHKLKYGKSLAVVLGLIICLCLFEECVNSADTEKKKPLAESGVVHFEEFAGTQTCLNCHQDIGKDYLHTMHFFTSQKASEQTIKGSFEQGKNYFVYGVGREVHLEKRDSGLYQVYYSKGIEKLSRRIDIVFGSGKIAQTYATWVGDTLAELPVSYFTTLNEWVNSPGYPLHPVLFNRPITSRCLECHSTYVEKISIGDHEPEAFDKNNLILGVTCERCHGPGEKHVKFQENNPGTEETRYIVNPAKLSRSLSLSLCGLCHSGRQQKSRPSFSFIAGDTLSKYFHIDSVLQNAANIDVHGNQLGMLANSKCFKMSQMTCMSCHDTHKNETGEKTVFIQKCMNCHKEQHKSIDGITRQYIQSNCIDCHMPEQPSRSIVFLAQNQPNPAIANMRTHYITVYPEETRKIVGYFKKAQKQ